MRRRGSNWDGFATNVLVAFEKTAHRDDIDIHPEEARQIIFDVLKVKEAASLFELNEEVDVTRLSVVAPGSGAEEVCPLSPIEPNDTQDLVTMCLHQLPTIAHDKIVPTACDADCAT